ncbi:hypothetical protein [Sphingopyxis sp.]|uniref:hypothetical protein n=1 Tax=Sphingopyxis sp. TaxID=1908224 RepID=UPI001E179E38|nr:hypothetical protein [Sphingopyxis sp.]MBW8296021.1 hypothetical protein [Sphingopyxis sp.]
MLRFNGASQTGGPPADAAEKSALLRVVAVLIGTLTALLAILAAILLLLMLFATLFFVALLLLIGVLVCHFLSPFASRRCVRDMRDIRSTPRPGTMLRFDVGVSPERDDGATNVISLRQPVRR